MRLTEAITQQAFGDLVGISQPSVSEMMRIGVLHEGGTARDWLLSYCNRLREQAAARMSLEAGGLDLAHERAALARSQREGFEIRNAALRAEFAPMALMNEVLCVVSQAVGDGFAQLPAQIAQACPQLGAAELQQVAAFIASAQAEWVRGTAELSAPHVMAADDEDAAPEPRDEADEA